MRSLDFLSPVGRTSNLEGSPSVDTPPPIERETNTIIQGKLDCLKETCSIPSGIQIKLPEVHETITFTRLGKVVYYEVAFYARLRLLIHPTIRQILHFYNICLAQLVPNAWRSVLYMMVLRLFHKFAFSLTEFK